jgi:ubiquinone biosynthesis protein
MRLNIFAQTGRNIDRLREIMTVLAKYGLVDWLGRVDARWARSLLRRSGTEELAGKSTAERVRRALADLGTTFIKFGQILSTRPDLVGPEMAAELAKLQTSAPADTIATVRQTIADELGKPPEVVFADFDPKPLASASIAQVHTATLRTGERVVVKVQHPGITERIVSDLEILHKLAEWGEKYSTQLRLYQPTAAVAQLRDTLMNELDFRMERRNLDRFNRNFARDRRVRFPRAHAELSGRRVLTMEFLSGVPGRDLERIRAGGVEPGQVALVGANVYLDMVFRDGFYHADPHPGNFLVLPEGVLGIIDCGMVGRLDTDLREEIESILMAIVARDSQRLADGFVRLGSVPPDFDRRVLRADIDNFLAEYADLPLEELDLGAALKGITDIIRSHRILLPVSISLLLRLLIMLDGTGRQMSAGFSLAQVLRPYYLKLLRRRYAPRRMLRELQRSYRDWAHLLETLPRDLGTLLRRMGVGALELHVEHRRLERTVDRLVQGVLIAALILGSSVMWAHKAPPTLFEAEISIPGVAAFFMALLLAGRLVYLSRPRDEDRP